MIIEKLKQNKKLKQQDTTNHEILKYMAYIKCETV